VNAKARLEEGGKRVEKRGSASRRVKAERQVILEKGKALRGKALLRTNEGGVYRNLRGRNLGGKRAKAWT